MTVHLRGRPDSFAAEVAADLRGNELVAGLSKAAYLPPEVTDAAWGMWLERTGAYLGWHETLMDAGVVDGDVIVIAHQVNGAGPDVINVAELLAAAKVAIDAGRLVVDAYRAQTERMALQLDREKQGLKKKQDVQDHDAEVGSHGGEP